MQLVFYSNMMGDDDNTKFEYTRDLIEYGAAFFDSKAVREVRQNRESDNSIGVSESEFKKQVSSGAFKSKEVMDIVKQIKNTNLKTKGKKKIRLKNDIISKITRE